MHYYKRNLGDYAKKAGRLSMLQHGSYTLLIDSCYDRERFPTLEEALDWTWASSKEEIEAVTFVLKRFFTLIDGVYIQERIAQEIAEYHEKAVTNKSIAIEREAKKRTDRESISTNRAPNVAKTAPNHKPLTINHNKSEVRSVINNTEQPVDNSGLMAAACAKLTMMNVKGDIYANNTRLADLIKAGTTLQDIENAVNSSPGKAINYILAKLEGQRTDQANGAWKQDNALILEKAIALKIPTVGKKKSELITAIEEKLKGKK